MGGNGCTKPRAGRPDVAPKLSFTGDASCKFKAGGVFAADERRRRFDAIALVEEAGEASVDARNCDVHR